MLEFDKKFLLLYVKWLLERSYSNYCSESEQSSNYRDYLEIDLLVLGRATKKYSWGQSHMLGRTQ